MRPPQHLFDFLAAMRTSCSAPSNAKEPAQQKGQAGDGALCRRGKNVFVHFIDAHSRRRPCDDKGDRRQGRKPGCCLFHSAASASVFNVWTATSVCPAARRAVSRLHVGRGNARKRRIQRATRMRPIRRRLSYPLSSKAGALLCRFAKGLPLLFPPSSRPRPIQTVRRTSWSAPAPLPPLRPSRRP